MSMSGAQERKQALIEHKVITDVLPGNLDLSYDLKVEWPETSLKQAGEELGREETQSEPTLSLSPTPSKPLSNLVLIMVDPVRRESCRHLYIQPLTHQVSGRISETMYRTVQDKLRFKRLFLTHKGRFGLAPATCRRNDGVALLPRVKAPMLIRPQSNFCQVVGPSYMKAFDDCNYVVSEDQQRALFDGLKVEIMEFR